MLANFNTQGEVLGTMELGLLCIKTVTTPSWKRLLIRTEKMFIVGDPVKPKINLARCTQKVICKKSIVLH